jgi:hypothetical protein
MTFIRGRNAKRKDNPAGPDSRTPCFREEPDGFAIEQYEIDEDHWSGVSSGPRECPLSTLCRDGAAFLPGPEDALPNESKCFVANNLGVNLTGH